MTLFNKTLIALGDLLRLKIWSKTKFSYAIDQFIVDTVYRLMNDFLVRDLFFTEAWFTPYLMIDNDEAFIDVGANVGFYTLRMAKRASHVFAFEPNPEVYKLLKSKTHGLTNVTCFPYALGRENKEVRLYVFDETRSPGSSTKRQSLKYALVQCFALDNLFKKNVINADKIRLVKIDVEGAEYDVLVGAKEFLMGFHPRILVEISNKDNLKKCTFFLKELGYGVRIVKELRSWDQYWLVAE